MMTPLHFVLLSAVCSTGAPNGIVLDFSASWCGPCQEMSPLVSRLEREGYSIRKVDVDREKELAQRFRIQNIPAFVLVVDGKEVTRLVGKRSETELRQLLAQIPQQAPQPVAQSAAQPIEQLYPAAQLSSAAVPQRPTDPVAATQAREAGQQLTQVAAAMPPKAPRFKLPFGAKRAPQVATPAVVRAKNDARSTPNANAPTGPLAASVRIRVKDPKGENFGSGTVIDSQIGRTLVLTCGHIFRDLDKSSTIEVDLFASGTAQTFVGQVVRYDREADVGLIAIPTDVPLPACRIAPVTQKILKDAPVISIGCGGGELPSVQKLRITALNRYLGPDNLECSGVPDQGRSGGGLLTKDGLVIGVCTAADPRDQRGLYAGLKAIHQLLDQCQLARLYRPAGQLDRGVLVATTGAVPKGNQASMNQQDEAQQQEAVERGPRSAAARNANAVVRSQNGDDEGEAIAEDLDSDGAERLREALRSVGPAEVVCVIRPINQPRGASRVVVLNRASRKFVAYLTDEMESQDEVQPTTLTKRPVTQQPAKRLSSAVPQGKQIKAKAAKGPQPYRRKQPA